MTNLSAVGPSRQIFIPNSGGGSPVYTGVTRTPPTLSSPTTYTSLDAMLGANNSDNSPILRTLSGISNSPTGPVIVLVGDPDEDLWVNFGPNDPNHVCLYPIHYYGFRNVRVTGLYQAPMLLAQNYSYPTEPYPYPKITWGGAQRIAIKRKFFMEGSVINMATNFYPGTQTLVPLNGDYVIWRGERMDGSSPYSDYLNSECVFQSCIFRGNEGTTPGSAGDTMYHADYWQNQTSSDPVGRPYELVFENCNLENGQEGVVFHGWNQGTGGTLPKVSFLNVDSNINKIYANQFDRGHGLHAALQDVYTVANYAANVTVSNVHFSRYLDWEVFAIIAKDPNRYLTDMVDNGGGGGQFIGNSELHRYTNVAGQLWNQIFVEEQFLGGNFYTPH